MLFYRVLKGTAGPNRANMKRAGTKIHLNEIEVKYWNTIYIGQGDGSMPSGYIGPILNYENEIRFG